MVSFKLQWRSSAYQDLENIDKKEIPRILKKVENLTNNPFPHGFCKLKDSTKSYRIRVGNYRVIYQVEKEIITVIIVAVRHRKDVYKKKR